uniref:Uncharacterized protein n=1 Tax=Tetraselmis sp. GSL018 TaxID=582737 RepID=A0A061SMD0_9CHLO
MACIACGFIATTGFSQRGSSVSLLGCSGLSSTLGSTGVRSSGRCHGMNETGCSVSTSFSKDTLCAYRTGNDFGNLVWGQLSFSDRLPRKRSARTEAAASAWHLERVWEGARGVAAAFQTPLAASQHFVEDAGALLERYLRIFKVCFWSLVLDACIRACSSLCPSVLCCSSFFQLLMEGNSPSILARGLGGAA